MAISYVKTTGVFRIGGSLSTSGSFSTLPAVGNTVVVLVSRSGSAGATISVSDNQGNSYTKAVESPNVSTCNTSSIWYANVGTSSGTFTVTATNSGSAGSSYISAVALEYSGLASSSLVDQTASNSGTGVGTLSSGSITTTNANDLLIGVCCSDKSSNQTWTDPGAPWTQRFLESSGANYEMGIGNDRIVSVTGTYSVSWSIDTTGGDLTAAIASLKASSSAITHDTTGSLSGDASTISGSSSRTGAAVTHSTSGSLTTAGSSIVGSSSRSGASPVLSASYERSSVKLSSSTVTGSGDSAVVSIYPRSVLSEVTSGITSWLEPSAKVTGVNGTRPTFRFLSYLTTSVDGKYWGQPWAAGRRPMYSYDGLSWTYFDTDVTIDGTNHWVEFRNSTAFTGDTVYISRGRQVTVSQMGDFIATLAGTYGFISPTPTAATFTPSTTTSFPAQAYVADEYSTQTDELGATVVATPLYGFMINDTSLMPASGVQKKTAVIFGGVHAGEDLANVVLQNTLSYLCGSSASAQNIRRHFKIYVYPLLNAPGRYGGHWRGSFQTDGTKDDLNRHFSDTTTLEIVTKPRTAVTTDLNGTTPAWMFDFHGDFGISTTPCASYYTSASAQILRWKTAWETYQGTTTNLGTTASVGTTTDYFINTLGVPYSITLEYNDAVPLSDATLVTQGENVIKALSDLTDAAAFGHDSVGALATTGSSVAGSSARSGAVITHDTTGVLSTANAIVVGTSAVNKTHSTSGTLQPAGAYIVANAGVNYFRSSVLALSGVGS